MKLIKSLITLFVVIIACILVFFYVYKAEEKRKEREAFERNLIRFDLDHIESFSLVNSNSSIVFERSVGRIWNITSPIISEASGDVLKDIFTSLHESKILFTVEENPEDIAKYGLEKPDFYLAIKYEIGDFDTLFSGSTTPDGSMSYIRFASENRVLTADRALINLLNRPVNTYRAETILNIVDDDVTALEIIRNNDEFISMQFDGIKWQMIEPWELEADQKNIYALLKEISSTLKVNFVSEKTNNLAQYGLDNPSLIFTVSLRYGMPDKMLLVGKQPEEKTARNLWYAKQFDNDLIFTVNDVLIDKFTYITEWFIEKNPLKFEKERVTKIIMETGNNSITFLRDAQKNWNVVSPVDRNLKIETINLIFGVSRFILVNRLFSLDPTEQETIEAGLDKPVAQFSFYENDTLINQIFFGKTIMEDQTRTYYKTDKSPVIYLTTTTITSNINKILNNVFGE